MKNISPASLSAKSLLFTIVAAFALSINVHANNTVGGLGGITVLSFGTSGTYNTKGATIGDASGNAITLSPFEAQLSSAFTAGTGGVLTFDTGNSNWTGPATVNYGVGGTGNTTLLTVKDSAGAIVNYTDNGNGSATSIFTGSNPGYLAAPTSSGGLDQSQLTFLLSSPSDGSSITNIGFTVLDRSGLTNHTVTATVTYSNSTTGTLTGSIASSDLFFDFQAPTGQSITQIALTGVGDSGRTAGVDGIAFLTSPSTTTVVPEPSTYALLLAGMAVLLFKARHRSRVRWI